MLLVGWSCSDPYLHLYVIFSLDSDLTMTKKLCGLLSFDVIWYQWCYTFMHSPLIIVDDKTADALSMCHTLREKLTKRAPPTL